MKFEKEATTKNGRRTWKVTYELVRGPEPMPRRKAEKPATRAAAKAAPKSEAKEGSSSKKQPSKPATKPTKREKGQAVKDAGQLGFF
jgi:hypothetical protein